MPQIVLKSCKIKMTVSFKNYTFNHVKVMYYFIYSKSVSELIQQISHLENKPRTFLAQLAVHKTAGNPCPCAVYILEVLSQA